MLALEALAALLIVAGVTFLALAALGILRLPSVYMRLHASAVGTTVGIGGVVLGTALHASVSESGPRLKEVLVLAFLLLTAPVASHVLGRAAYLTGAPHAPPAARAERRPGEPGGAEDVRRRPAALRPRVRRRESS
ncbi:MAG TPA: monovalent cation/H(+) antiporter subunit G [Thermodesulfobacteriota bacterium]